MPRILDAPNLGGPNLGGPNLGAPSLGADARFWQGKGIRNYLERRLVTEAHVVGYRRDVRAVFVKDEAIVANSRAADSVSNPSFVCCAHRGQTTAFQRQPPSVHR